jgi:hypothetical protein
MTKMQLLCAKMALENIAFNEKINGKLTPYLTKMRAKILDKVAKHDIEQTNKGA